MRTLKIDLDIKPEKEWMELWIKTRTEMLRSLGYNPIKIDTFETQKGTHIYIKLKEDPEDRETNMLQFLCGDDPIRVKINNWRINRKVKMWNKLFKRVLYRKNRKKITCPRCEYEMILK